MTPGRDRLRRITAWIALWSISVLKAGTTPRGQQVNTAEWSATIDRSLETLKTAEASFTSSILNKFSQLEVKFGHFYDSEIGQSKNPFFPLQQRISHDESVVIRQFDAITNNLNKRLDEKKREIMQTVEKQTEKCNEQQKEFGKLVVQLKEAVTTDIATNIDRETVPDERQNDLPSNLFNGLSQIVNTLASTCNQRMSEYSIKVGQLIDASVYIQRNNVHKLAGETRLFINTLLITIRAILQEEMADFQFRSYRERISTTVDTFKAKSLRFSEAFGAALLTMKQTIFSSVSVSHTTTTPTTHVITEVRPGRRSVVGASRNGTSGTVGGRSTHFSSASGGSSYKLPLSGRGDPLSSRSAGNIESENSVNKPNGPGSPKREVLFTRGKRQNHSDNEVTQSIIAFRSSVTANVNTIRRDVKGFWERLKEQYQKSIKRLKRVIEGGKNQLALKIVEIFDDTKKSDLPTKGEALIEDAFNLAVVFYKFPIIWERESLQLSNALKSLTSVKVRSSYKRDAESPSSAQNSAVLVPGVNNFYSALNNVNISSMNMAAMVFKMVRGNVDFVSEYVGTGFTMLEEWHNMFEGEVNDLLKSLQGSINYHSYVSLYQFYNLLTSTGSEMQKEFNQLSITVANDINILVNSPRAKTDAATRVNGRDG